MFGVPVFGAIEVMAVSFLISLNLASFDQPLGPFPN
jgi:hypothetical protein